MTQEEKDLLLKDLCGRLPYGVKFHYTKHPESNIDQNCDGTAIGYYCNLIVSANDKDFCVDRCKLYLRPLSSMTEGEQKILEDFGVTISPFSDQMHVPFDEIEFPFITMQKIISYLYSIHIDINGMIPKGLAIEVTKDNNPYKD